MDRYDEWKKACDELDEGVKKWNADPSKPGCPLCGNRATARWNYDGDYDIHVFIECDDCSCRVKGWSLEDVDAQWSKRVSPLMSIGK